MTRSLESLGDVRANDLRFVMEFRKIAPGIGDKDKKICRR